VNIPSFAQSTRERRPIPGGARTSRQRRQITSIIVSAYVLLPAVGISDAARAAELSAIRNPAVRHPAERSGGCGRDLCNAQSCHAAERRCHLRVKRSEGVRLETADWRADIHLGRDGRQYGYSDHWGRLAFTGQHIGCTGLADTDRER
jgi:hypothetical protein